MTFPFPCLVADPAGGGRPGNALLEPDSAVSDCEEPPQDLFWETWEREDCAVEDLSLRTRVDFAADGWPEEDDEALGVTFEAQPRGIAPLLVLVTGSDG